MKLVIEADADLIDYLYYRIGHSNMLMEYADFQTDPIRAYKDFGNLKMEAKE